MKTLILFLLVFSLGACSVLPSADTNSVAEEKVLEDTVLVGTLSNGAVVVLRDDGGTVTDLDSYSVDFAEYDGKRVRVSGQYSGTTLFVDEISLGK